MAVTIARHCVASSPDGLSPLQSALLTAPERVRIADAPTGAGKTYAFQQAVARGERVLFVVPTRRLAQNIAAGLIRDLAGMPGWSAEQAEGKVEIWSSDRTTQLREQGITRIAGHRIRQIQALDPTREGGEMVITVPEVLSHLLLRFRMEAGQAAAGIFEVLDFFDHIVFDEFHTIEARGFGLAALCARLASAENPDGSRFGRARVSFLSATPLDIRPVLERIGIEPRHIVQLRETLTDDGRPVHGDVALSMVDADSLAELVEANLDTVAAEVAADRQVVLIYNRLGDLIREMPTLLASLQGRGIAAERVLVVNSISDSGSNRDGVHPLGYRSGRFQNPDEFSVLVATASIEMGVTFREANLMLMEPGFAPMNFLQRYGRAARRGADGAVMVRHDPASSKRHPWIRDLHAWISERDGEQVEIGVLTAHLCRDTQKQFAEKNPEESRFFGALPNRAAFTTGLYWNALVGHPSNSGPRRQHLLAHQPPTARKIYALLKQVRTMEEDRFFRKCAKLWCDRFEQQAYVLRDIAQRIAVHQIDGNTVHVDPIFLGRETEILDRLPVTDGPDGPEIRLSGMLEDYLRNEREPQQRMVTVLFPHTGNSADLKAGATLVDDWCRDLQGRGGDAGMAWDDFPEAMAAAEQLVRLTGLVPSDDDSLSVAAISSVL